MAAERASTPTSVGFDGEVASSAASGPEAAAGDFGVFEGPLVRSGVDSSSVCWASRAERERHRNSVRATSG